MSVVQQADPAKICGFGRVVSGGGEDPGGREQMNLFIRLIAFYPP